MSCVNGIVINDITDHFPIFHICKDVVINEEEKIIFKRNFTHKAQLLFTSLLQDVDWSCILNESDTNKAYAMFVHVYSDIYNKAFPKTRAKIKYYHRKPWLTEVLKNSIRQKNKLFKLSKKYPVADSIVKYKTYRSTLNKLLKRGEKLYYQDLFSGYRDNMQKTWSVIKRILNKSRGCVSRSMLKHDNETITDDYSIANTCNNFFVNVGSDLANRIPDSRISPYKYMKTEIMNSIFLETVSPEELLEVIKGLKHSAVGYDELDAQHIKSSSPIIIQPLLHICNLSFTHGVFPDAMKIAKVSPLFKSGNYMKVNNYRPVSILPVLSKILERLMYNRLMKFVEDFDILYDFQFGFRKCHSTFMALASSVNHIVNALQFGKYSIGVYLDFSKAFDTLNHDILFLKLNHYGIRGIALDWIKSYMVNRKQYVMYNDNSSDIRSITCGVPQGSILGPLLFLLYVNDLPNISDILFTIMFADDTSMFINGNDLKAMETQLNSELKEVSIWLQVNKLSLNVEKSCFVVFKSVKKSDLEVNLCINDKCLSRVNQVKFLGTIIDHKLTWRPHIDYISKKLSKAIAIMYRIKPYVTQETLCGLYYSLIYPYLTYCNVIWGNTFKTHLKPIISLQRKAVRCLNFRNYNDFSTDALMIELKLIKLSDLNKYLTCQFMHKLHYGLVPNVFNDYFTCNRSVHEYNTRLREGFHVPKIGNDYGKRTLKYNGCLLWNKIILLNVNFDCSLASFQHKIRYNLSSL